MQAPDSSELALYFSSRCVLCPLGLDWQIQTGELNSYEIPLPRLWKDLIDAINALQM